MAYRVTLAASARDDLKAIFRHLSDVADVNVAAAYDARIRQACFKLSDFPHRGSPHDDLAPGLRSMPFERQATIFYRVEADLVRIIRVLHAGRDVDAAFED